MTAAAAPEASTKTSAWAPLARPVYRMLWIAQMASAVGVWMQSVGAQWFLVEEHTGPAIVAWVQTASLAPVLLLSLLAGVLADEYNRRLLLICTTFASSLVAATLAVLAHFDLLQPWSLLLMTFLLGCCSALTSPAWQAIQPELVPRAEIPAASALGGVAVNGARAVGPAIGGLIVAAVGPAIGGLIVAAVGPAAVFALNALSFVGVTLALVAWHRPPDRTLGPRESWTESLLAGLRYVRSAPIVQRLLLRAGLFVFPAGIVFALAAETASRRLHLGATGYGLLLGVLGVGSLMGVAMLSWVRARLSDSVILAGSAALYAVGVFALAVFPLAAILPLLLVAGAAWIGTLTVLNANMQLALAPWVRARGMAIYILIMMGGQAVGSFLWGALAGSIGVTTTYLIAAGLLVLTAISVYWWPLLAKTGKLDRTIVAYCAPTPTLILDPRPEDGPVTLSIHYHLPPESRSSFREAMEPVERSRRRTGGYAWRLEQSGTEADMFREEFTLDSWADYERSREQRWLKSDEDTYEAATALLSRPPMEYRYLPSDIPASQIRSASPAAVSSADSEGPSTTEPQGAR